MICYGPVEAAIFGEDDWNVLPSLRLNAGIRFSLFNVERKAYTLLEPRALEMVAT